MAYNHAHEKPPGVAIRPYPYSEYQEDIHVIAERVRDTGRPFEKIHGLPRGGLVPAVHLSNLLKLDLCFDFINPDPVCWCRESAAKILVVDDIAHTGQTLKRFHDAGFFIATLFYDPENSIVRPDIYAREKDWRWIDYFWEV